jgi:hypothetical protein
VAKSQSQQPKSHFPSLKIDQSQFPFYPFRALGIVKFSTRLCEPRFCRLHNIHSHLPILSIISLHDTIKP